MVSEYRPEEEMNSNVVPGVLVPSGTIDFKEEKVERTYDESVSVLDVILNSIDIGKPVNASWNWSRKGISVPIRSLLPDELRKISKKNTKQQRIARSDRFHTELEVDDYNLDVVATGVLNPDLQDPLIREQLAKKFQTNNDIHSLIKKIWLPGEITSLVMAILETSGFVDDEETIKSVKD